MKIRVSVDIDAPPAAVWAQLERIEDHVLWMRDAERIRFTGRRRRGVGTAFVCDTRLGPFRLADSLEVTQWQPERGIAVAHRGLVRGDGRFGLRPRRGDRTRFTWTERLTFPWWLGGPITAMVARPVLRWVWKRNLRAFAALVQR